MEFPVSIQKIIEGKPYKCDNIGESGSAVLLFDEMVLKVERTSEQSDREYESMKWLKGKLPVPEVIEFERKDGYNYLLMTRLKARSAYDNIKTGDLNLTVKALADGIKKLWSIDVSSCPLNSRLYERLKAARYNIDNNLVDTDDFEEDTFGANGFKDTEELYEFLKNNKPTEDAVLTHGDYCLPNVFMKGEECAGFIDLGKTGTADRWQDIALCVRSLEYNVCNVRGESRETYLNLKQYFYDLLGIEEDKEKLRYYILLDELF